MSDSVGSASFDSEYYTMSDFSSWGVPTSLEMKPEITAPDGSDQYESMSGTSMATPQVSGMAVLVAQYIRENKLAEKTQMPPTVGPKPPDVYGGTDD